MLLLMYGNDVTYFGRHIVYCTNVYNVCSGDDAIAPITTDDIKRLGWYKCSSQVLSSSF